MNKIIHLFRSFKFLRFITTSGRHRAIDSIIVLEYQVKILSATLIAFVVLIVFMAGLIAFLLSKASDNLSNQRLVLVPAIHQKLEYPANSYISETYIQAVSNKVVELNESWSYDTYVNNVNELCRDYYQNNLCIITRSALSSSNREDYLLKNRVVSQFVIDKNKSRYHFCEALKRPCSLVIGKRRLFFNYNETVTEKDVAYLIIGDGVWPDSNNPFALRISRLKINDLDENPANSLEPILELALKGDESVLKNN